MDRYKLLWKPSEGDVNGHALAGYRIAHVVFDHGSGASEPALLIVMELENHTPADGGRSE